MKRAALLLKGMMYGGQWRAAQRIEVKHVWHAYFHAFMVCYRGNGVTLVPIHFMGLGLCVTVRKNRD
jgi:hypothetical protein